MKNTHKIVLFTLAMSLYGCSPYHGISQENIEKSLIACASMGGLKAIEIRGYSRPNYWERHEQTRYSDWVEVKDDKWTDVFLLKCPYHKSDVDKYSVSTFSKPKIVSVLRHEPMALTVEQYSWYCPQRVVNKTDVYGHWPYVEKELIEVEIKK